MENFVDNQQGNIDQKVLNEVVGRSNITNTLKNTAY